MCIKKHIVELIAVYSVDFLATSQSQVYFYPIFDFHANPYNTRSDMDKLRKFKSENFNMERVKILQIQRLIREKVSR